MSEKKPAQNPRTAEPSPLVAPRLGSREIAALGGVLVLTFLAFLPVLGNGFTNWDDPYYVTENPLVRDSATSSVADFFTTPVMGNYHPVTMLSLSIDARLGGLEAGMFHITSLLLHLVNTVLVFLTFRALANGRFVVGIFVAAFFAIHPMHVESVAWISARKDVLYTLFFFAGLLAWLRYRAHDSRSAYVASIVAFLASAASKPAAVPFPVVLILVDLWQRRRIGRAMFVDKLPFFAIAVVFGIATIRVQSSMGAIAIGELETLTIVERALFASYGFVAYIVKLFVPIGLSSWIPYPPLDESLPWTVRLAPLGVAAILGVTAWLVWRDREGDLPRATVFGLAFYFVMIALTLQFVSVGYVLLAERYTYVPYVGLLFALGMAVDRVMRASPKAMRATTAAVVLVAVGFSALTYARTRVWHSSGTLWSNVIAQYPDVALAYANRASFHKSEGRLDEALADYERAIEIDPESSDAWYNRGVFFEDRGDTAKALADYDRAIELDPTSFRPRLNRGNLHKDAGRADAAITDYSAAAEAAPDHAETYYLRGLAYSMPTASFEDAAQRIQKAIADFTKATEKRSGFASAYLNRGVLHYRLGNLDDALRDFSSAIRYAPANGRAWLNRSGVLRDLGRLDEARSDAEKARSLGTPVDDAYMKSLERP